MMIRLATIAFLSATLGTQLRAETIALWLFDDPVGSSVALDSSGNGYHLTLGPDAAITPQGKFGGALDADATPNDGLGAFRYRAEKPLNPDDEDWTLECWLRAKPGMNADNRIWGLSGVNYVDLGRGGVGNGLFIGNRYLPIDGVEAWDKPTGDIRADQQFHHFALVYDSESNELRHYFDGKKQFEAAGVWKDVPTGEAPYADVIMPPHYPMLQIGCRDAYQQWNHREIHLHKRQMKKFQGYIDEMRFSAAALYQEDFEPSGSFAKREILTWPDVVHLSLVEGEETEQQRTLLVLTGQSGQKVSVRAEAKWLSVTPHPNTEQYAVAADIRSLQPGVYESSVTVAAGSLGSREVPVKVLVAKQNSIRDIGDRKQLFIDRRFIESSENVELRTNPAQKIGIDFPDAHYPRNIVYLEDKRVWRMYFSPWANLEHAESTDGIHWERFGSGKIGYESEEQPGTLIPLNFHAVVMYDPQDVPARRFKAFQEVTSHALDADGYEVSQADSEKPRRELAGIYGFYSSDGLTFKKAGRVFPVLPEFVSCAPHYDHNTGSYVCFFRCQNTKLPGLTSIQGCQFYYQYGFSYENPKGLVFSVAPETMGQAGFENLRSISRIQTDDLLAPWPVAENAEANTMYATSSTTDMVATADFWDGFADLYVHATTVYPYAEDVYLMFPTFFRHFHPSRQPWFHAFDDANGPLETTLAVSRDGVHWDRVDRKAYIPNGRHDEADRWRTMAGLGMTRAGNDLYQYYWYGGDLHDSLPLRPEMARDPRWSSGLGLVKQRLDGFVSAEVDYRGGCITTPPIQFQGDKLEVNYSCGAQGDMFVELRDLSNQPIPGFTLGDCEEVSGDDVAWDVRWRGSSDVSSLAGKPVKIHFKMRNAKLFAFQFVGEDTPKFQGPPSNPPIRIGEPPGAAMAGLPIAVQSSGDVVVAKQDQYVEILHGDDLTKRQAVAGRFGSTVTGLAVLSDDAVVVGTLQGELQVRSSNLAEVLAGNNGMAGPADGIQHIAIDRDDNIVIKTVQGRVRVVSRDLQEISPLRQLVHQ